ncbi:hypothetical protein IQE94_05995 [Synechocystis sp. PCC 7339]|uniref:hypothetical protein n=1 Tax=Synechocystis sp. PCC 7339 TaxID=2782213 RepID=UPI001CBD2381|nr:hypothetical protein [Synechocystis sp. PCC 7339]UAJ73819.1 hypothetical protein IQE94_05995 [Synechocystis sp. PCC 7339]
MPDSINEFNYNGKPDLKWIESYTRNDKTVVDGHYRTEENETIADNLNTDIDGDGIFGYFDADADGDGIVDISQDFFENIDFLEDTF